MPTYPDHRLGSLLYGNAQRHDPMGDGTTFGGSRFDTKGKGRATPQNGDILALDLNSAEEGAGASNGDAFMQMQLVEQQVSRFRHYLCVPVKFMVISTL